MLTADHISFRYQKGNRQILQNFSLSLERGEVVGLHAPSGFGKTTLCKILAGYQNPDVGRMLLDGSPLAARKGYCPVQMIWQHPELVVNPRLKMAEVLKEAGTPEPHIVSGLGIESGWLSRYPAELSGGELQRFCIARALLPKTEFLIADEITTMLDLITAAQIWTFLREEAKRRRLGLLVVSHSMPLLDQICNRVVDLAEGTRSYSILLNNELNLTVEMDKNFDEFCRTT